MRPGAGPARRLDWRGLLRAGLHELRLTPDQFWALTPAELAVMLGLEAAPAAMTRDRLASLSQLYPDIPAATPADKGLGDDDADE